MIIRKLFDNRINSILSLIFGIILAVSIFVGRAVYYSDGFITRRMGSEFSVSMLLRSIMLVVIFALGVLIFFRLLNLLKMPSMCRVGSDYSWHVSLLLGVLLWMLLSLSFYFTFLALYPGNLAYDFSAQAYYYFGILPFTKHHPPLHSFLIFGAIKYGTEHEIYAESVNAILQGVFFSFAISCGVVTLSRLKLRWGTIVVVAMYYLFNPVFSIFAVTTTKDTLFGSAFLLMTTLLMHLCVCADSALENSMFKISFTMVTMLCCLLRNNAIYAIILSIPVVVFCLKKYWKSVIILLAIPVFCFFFIDKVVYTSVLNIGEGSSGEKLCVPMQQLASVVYCYEEELAEDDLAFINEFFEAESLPRAYNPRFADPVKSLFIAEKYDTDKLKFWKGWAKIGLEYPKCYLESFLTLNIPYWYIGANTIDPYSKTDYIEFNAMHRMEELSKFPKALRWLERFASYEIVNDNPVLKPLFSITTPFWLLLTTLFVLLYKRRYNLIPAICPAIFLWLTLIAGPVSNFRYIFPLVSIYPCIFIILWSALEKKNEVT